MPVVTYSVRGANPVVYSVPGGEPMTVALDPVENEFGDDEAIGIETRGFDVETNDLETASIVPVIVVFGWMDGLVIVETGSMIVRASFVAVAVVISTYAGPVPSGGRVRVPGLSPGTYRVVVG